MKDAVDIHSAAASLRIAFPMNSTNTHESDEAQLLHSWHRNAAAWTQVVRDALLESRRLATDQAIIDAVLDGRPASVLDIGCGEGWLVRALAARGLRAMGVDAVPALIERAREAGGPFAVASYEDIIAGKLAQCAETLVCNFSLLGKASVEQLLAALPSLLEANGRLIVQTVHPWVACGGEPYVDGWRLEHWAGLEATFPAPAPWYFRTLASWMALFTATGWYVRELREPLQPQTGRPASVVFMAERQPILEGRT
jgi:2-polyprenyl-3-methyl-5-hydroxy-6-metoxy-1,4-benzoquinol methylase